MKTSMSLWLPSAEGASNSKLCPLALRFCMLSVTRLMASSVLALSSPTTSHQDSCFLPGYLRMSHAALDAQQMLLCKLIA